MDKNIEDLIKEEFKDRELEVATESFEKLDAKLKEHARKTRTKNFRVMFYAASIIGILFFSQSLLKTDGSNSIETEISNEVFEQENRDQISSAPNENTILEKKIEESDVKSPSRFYKKMEKVEPQQLAPSKGSMQIAATSSAPLKDSIESIPLEGTPLMAFKDTFNYASVPIEVTDEEISALLSAANASIGRKGRDSLIVDAQRMLYELEVEINKPLPEKVMLTVKSGVLTLKEIVKSKDDDNNK